MSTEGFVGVANNANNGINSNIGVKIVDTNNISVISTTLSSSLTAGNGIVATPVSMTSIGVGTPLLIDSLASLKQETITVLSVTVTTFTANFRFAHAAGASVILSVERQNMTIADSTTYGNIASVATGPALATDTGLTVRPIPTALAAGTNSLGTVGLNTGSNVIGAVTQSGTWNVGILAGTNIIGKLGIDQTTPGVTNGVQITGSLPAGSNALGSVTITGTTAISGTVALGAGSASVGTVGLNSGTNTIGKVGFDQSTPGVTNGVQLSGGPGTSAANLLSSQNYAAYNTTPPTLTNGTTGSLQLDSTGNLKTVQAGPLVTGTNSIGTVGLNSGNNLVGKFGIDQTTPGTTNGVQINAALPTGSNTIGNVGQAGTWNVGLNAGTNIIGNLRIDQTTPGTTNGVQVVAALPAGGNTIGFVSLNASANTIGNVNLNAGSNVVGKFSIDQTTPGTTNAVQLSGPGTSAANLLFTEDLGVYNSTPPTLTSGQTSAIQLDANGNQKVVQTGPLPTGTNSLGTVGLNTGANTIGKVGIDQSTPGTSNAVQLTGTLPTGTNSLGTVGINAGSNVIGAVTQSGTFTVGLNTSIPAGTNIIGRTGIDQTSPGNTNGVQITGPGTTSANTLFQTPVGTFNATPPSLTTGQSTTLQLDTNGNQKVNIATALPTGSNTLGNVNINGTVSVTGSVSIGSALPTGTNSIGTVGLNAGTNIVGKVGFDQTTPGVTNGVQINAALPTGTNSIGAVTQGGAWNIGLNAGTNLVGKFGIDQTTPGTSNGVQITGPGTSSTNTLFEQSLGVYNSTPPTLTNGQASPIQLDVNGNQKVAQTGPLPTGTNSLGTVGINTGNNSIGTVGLNTGSNVVGKFGIDQSTPGTSNGVQLLTALPSGANTIGAVNLNAGTNSLGTVGLNAGSNVIGKVTIDQTTPGTSNAIQVTGPGTSTTNALFNQALGIFSSTPPTLSNGQVSPLQLDSSGRLEVVQTGGINAGTNSIGTVGLNAGTNSVGTVGLNAGTNVIGKTGIDQTTPGTSNGVQVVAALPTGTNSIGSVNLNTGSNSIGTVGLNAGTQIIGNIRIDQTTPGVTNAIQITGPGVTAANPIFAEQVGIYNSTPPTLTNGQIASTQLDVNGNQKVSIQNSITLTGALPTGANTIGSVVNATGTNSIGTVGLNAGANTIGAVTQAGTWNATINTSLPAGSNVIGKFGIDQTTPGTTNGVQITGTGTSASNPLYAGQVGVYNTAPPTLTNGQVASSQIDVNGNQKVNLATSLPAGANLIGKFGIDQTTPGSTNAVQITGPGTTSSNPLYAGQVGVYNTTAPTLTNGQVASSQIDVNGNQKVNLATSIPTGTNTIGSVKLTDNAGNTAAFTTAGILQTQSINDATGTTSYTAAAANTIIRAVAGRLVAIVVTTTPTGNVLIYDNATTNAGTIIGVIPASAPIGYVQVFAMPAANGIIVAGSTNNGAFTISWR